MVGASALIAVTSLIAKALGQGVGGPALHPFQVSAGRFVSGFLAVALVAAWLRPSLAGTPWRAHAVRSLCGWCGVSCLFAAAAQLPLATATALSFLSPIATMALAIPLLGERVGAVRWLAAAVALTGAMVLLRPGTDAFDVAALIALAAALFMGLEAILIKRLTGYEPPLRILLVNNAFGAVIAGSVAWFVWTEPSAGQWPLLALVGVAMVAAQTCFLFAMRGADASFVIPFFYATLIFAAAYDYAVFADAPDALGLAGAATIVVGGVMLAVLGGRERA